MDYKLVSTISLLTCFMCRPNLKSPVVVISELGDSCLQTLVYHDDIGVYSDIKTLAYFYQTVVSSQM